MAISSLFIVLAIVTSAWSLAQTENRGGNSACAQWCAANFAPTPGANCTQLAAHGTGPCYVCGPRSTNPREKLCGGACRDTSLDSNNCGTCGNVCITGSTCSQSACVCTNSGKPPCNGQCPDLTSDNNNCGTCGHSCISGTTCQSGACAPNCLNYTASCSDVINGILATNSIASPQLVDYRMQTAILGITSPSDFLAALGANPCQIYADPTEHDTCVELLANSEFLSQLTDITIGVLTAFQTCASDFATGSPDYQVIINEPDNTTCGGSSSVRRYVKRAGEDHDLTQSMLEGIEHYRMTAAAPVLGQMKSSSDLIQLVRKQQSTCSQTGICFERCPDCRDQQTYCGSTAAAITTNVCGGVGAIVGAGVGALVGTACATLCAPTGPGAATCAVFCAAAAGGLAGTAATATCTSVSSSICTPLTERCANCNSANNGICNADSTQCCAGETGTQCGANCCCCPRCQAPGGINCACTAAPC